tara:strand:- start:2337 stop:3638 length:1302 start_codon:yes stop_codon:yes gene_type:complete
MASKLLKGFRDIYPLADSLIEDSILWSYINKIVKKRLENYNFEEIITPSIENIDTFKNGMGDDTDIVSKEMYEFMLFKDGEIKDKITYALRPEGTASVVRAYLENSLYKKRKINKLYYIGPMFRYERSQKGRYRQFYQVGAEILGSDQVFYELELVMLAINLIKEFGIKDFDLEINCLGDNESLLNLSNQVKVFAKDNKKLISSEDLKIVDKNPLRFLDKAIHKYDFKDMPSSLEYISEKSMDRFLWIQDLLKENGIIFKINSQLVRGIDYYNDFVFEIKSKNLGAQDTILAGGRYDNLVSKLGGPSTNCVGFAAGIERLILLSDIKIKENAYKKIDFFIAYQNNNYINYVFKISNKLRNMGFNIYVDYDFKSFIKQIKSADKLNSKMLIAIGEEEFKNNNLKIKDMKTGKENSIDYDLIEKDILKLINNEKK